MPRRNGWRINFHSIRNYCGFAYHTHTPNGACANRGDLMKIRHDFRSALFNFVLGIFIYSSCMTFNQNRRHGHVIYSRPIAFARAYTRKISAFDIQSDHFIRSISRAQLKLIRLWLRIGFRNCPLHFVSRVSVWLSMCACVNLDTFHSRNYWHLLRRIYICSPRARALSMNPFQFNWKSLSPPSVLSMHADELRKQRHFYPNICFDSM